MHPIRRRRLFGVLLVLVGISIAIACALFALRQDIDLYVIPKEIKQRHLHAGQHFRLGGVVKRHSVVYGKKELLVDFVLTDFSDVSNDRPVRYKGILPDLFREGQGIVAEGKLDEKGIFVADRVLAKHDEKYHPMRYASITPKEDNK